MMAMMMDATGNQDAQQQPQQPQQRLLTSRKGQEESLPVTEDTLDKLRNMVVLEREGVVYCPVPKVNGRHANLIVRAEGVPWVL